MRAQRQHTGVAGRMLLGVPAAVIPLVVFTTSDEALVD